MRVHSFDEWSPLKEVIVGSPIKYETPELELSFKLFFHDEAYASFWYPYYEQASDGHHRPSSRRTPVRNLSKQYLAELDEDVQEFVTTLQRLGVTVHRPMVLNEVVRFKTPYWEASTIPALNVRDQAIIMGHEIIETPPQVRARYF